MVIIVWIPKWWLKTGFTTSYFFFSSSKNKKLVENRFYNFFLFLFFLMKTKKRLKTGFSTSILLSFFTHFLGVMRKGEMITSLSNIYHWEIINFLLSFKGVKIKSDIITSSRTFWYPDDNDYLCSCLSFIHSYRW